MNTKWEHLLEDEECDELIAPRLTKIKPHRVEEGEEYPKHKSHGKTKKHRVVKPRWDQHEQ